MELEAMGLIGINLGITVVLAGSYLWIMRKQDGAEKISGVCCFLTIIFFLDRICCLIMEGIAQGDAWEGLRLAGIVLAKCIEGILLLLAGSFKGVPGRCDDSKRGKKRTKGIEYEEWLIIMGSAFFGCVLAGTGWFLGEGIHAKPRRDGSLELEFLLTIGLFVVLFLFYLSAFWHKRTLQRRQERRRRQDEEKEAEHYLYTIESNYQRTRELWHDLRNHISLLNLLLQEEKYDQMRDYLQVFGEEVDKITLPVKSGNLILDAVLMDKASRARGKKVELELELCDFTGLALKPDEICSLFGNLLDNAIEAAIGAEGGGRIQLTCRMREDEYYISVKNTVSRFQGKPEERLVSRKEDRENVVGHGLGLRSVERVVNRYQGELVTDSGEGQFTVIVRLPKGQ